LKPLSRLGTRPKFVHDFAKCFRAGFERRNVASDSGGVHNPGERTKFAFADRDRFYHRSLVGNVKQFDAKVGPITELLASRSKIGLAHVGSDRSPALGKNGFDDRKADARSAKCAAK
jgi:hypothetical protein